MQDQEVRYQVLYELKTLGQTIGRSGEAIHRTLKRQGYNCTQTQVTQALAYLAGDDPPLSEAEFDRVQNIEIHRITTAGIRHCEREGIGA